jgi:hypothetical protein
MKPDQHKRPESVIEKQDEMLENAMGEILRSIKAVRYGSIEVTIHDSRVVQIERKEKVRFTPVPRARSD